MSSHRALRGLYAITDRKLIPPGQLADRVEAVLAGGARIIQYRDKAVDEFRREREGRRLLLACRRYKALLIVNDDVALAAKIGADGVHLGKEDCRVEEARRLLGPRAVIGVSCYNRLARAQEAQMIGADYVAFGRFFPSETKPEAVPAEPSLLLAAKQQIRIPIAAIGGITLKNARSLLDAGADMLAVIHGVFASPDCEQAARGFASLFSDAELAP